VLGIALRPSTLGNCSMRCSTESIPGLVISLSAVELAPSVALALRAAFAAQNGNPAVLSPAPGRSIPC
jgi:hypothetical protein